MGLTASWPRPKMHKSSFFTPFLPEKSAVFRGLCLPISTYNILYMLFIMLYLIEKPSSKTGLLEVGGWGSASEKGINSEDIGRRSLSGSCSFFDYAPMDGNFLHGSGE